MNVYDSNGFAAPDGDFKGLHAALQEADWVCKPERLEGADILYVCVGPRIDGTLFKRILGKFVDGSLTISSIVRNGDLLVGNDLQNALGNYGFGSHDIR